MVSPELLRRFEFFSKFSDDQLKTFALWATDRWFDRGHRFFGDGEHVNRFYVVVEGKVGITLDATVRKLKQDVVNQLRDTLESEQHVVGTIDRGEVFGWSSLLPPYHSTAGAVTLVPCDVVTMDAKALRSEMERDPAFGFRLAQRISEVIHRRLLDRQIEYIVGRQPGRSFAGGSPRMSRDD